MSGGAVSPLSPIRRCPQGLTSTSRTPTAMRASNYTPDGTVDVVGRAPTDPGQFNVPHNICVDPDGWLTLPTARTTGCRFSMERQVRDATGYPTGPNGMRMALERTRSFTSARAVPRARSTATGRISGRGSASTPIRARCWRGSAGCMPGSSRGISPRRTASPSTGTRHPLCRRIVRAQLGTVLEGPAAEAHPRPPQARKSRRLMSAAPPTGRLAHVMPGLVPGIHVLAAK